MPHVARVLFFRYFVLKQRPSHMKLCHFRVEFSSFIMLFVGEAT